MTLRLSFVVFAAVLQTVAIAQDSKPATWSGKPEENELVANIDDLYQRYDALYAELAKITDKAEQLELFEKKDPSQEFALKMLALEERHRRTNVGLMALRHVVLKASAVTDPNDSRNKARLEAINRLRFYVDRSVLPEILRYLDDGDFAPATESALRSLLQADNADETVREFIRLMLAESMLAAKSAWKYRERRLAELNAGQEMLYATEKQNLERELQHCPAPSRIQDWETEAIALLQSIATSGRELHQPAFKAIDPKWYLIQFDAERTKSMPLLSKMAEGLLFKEQHLRVGKPAPDLKVTLVSGQEWLLAEQRGKVVVLQFSFKGCGPCEAMYPELAKLQMEYGERLSILSIMADEDKADTEAAVADGKLTWNVHWDRFRGPVATRWAVRGFPTVYVIDRQGLIAAENRRDLAQKIAELLK